MKVIHTASRYFPQNCGGIQVHIADLATKMQQQGVQCQIAAAQSCPQEDTYFDRGIEVYRYPAYPSPPPEPNTGNVPHAGFQQFAHWLKQQKANVYHQHQWTPRCGLPHLRLAKELGMATIVTIHLPEPICQRGTMMQHGQQACDGRIDVVRCSQCCGVSPNLPPSMLKPLSQIPIPVSQTARKIWQRSQGFSKPIAAAADTLLHPLMQPRFVQSRFNSLIEMARYADRIITLCQWLYDALLINGLPPEKLALCRLGIDVMHLEQPPSKPLRDRLNVGFLGRWNPTKGIHILVEAIQRLPIEIPIHLTIHAVEDAPSYRQRVLAQIGTDPRIQVAPALKRAEISNALANFDVLAIPSQWMENGPLVVLEAHSVGTPVIGSNLGGIAELVHANVDGIVLPFHDVEAWSAALAKIATDRAYLNALCQGIRPVRSLQAEVTDLLGIYQQALHATSPQTALISSQKQITSPFSASSTRH